VGFGFEADFFCLAAAHEEARIRTLPRAGDGGHGDGSRGSGQLREFTEILRIQWSAQPQAHEYRALTSAWTLEHQLAVLSSAPSSSTPGTRTLRAGTTVEIACL
jgi:hypothetical protein